MNLTTNGRPVIVFVESSYTGAGRDCMLAARELGYEPILLCRDDTPYEFARELRVPLYVCDTRDVESTMQTVRGLGDVVGVGTTDDYSVAVAAAVAELLGLPTPGADAALRCRDKHRQRVSLPGHLSPTWAVAVNEEEAVEAASSIGYPIVLKPTNLTGSSLVRRCTNAAEVRSHFRYSLAKPATSDTPAAVKFLVEQYVDGPEFSVELFQGEIIGVTRKQLFSGSTFIESGHDFPLPDSALASRIGIAARDAVQAVGLLWGPAHVEVRDSARGPRVIEINARIPGNRIPRLIQLTTGRSLAQDYVRVLVGANTTLSDGQPLSSAASLRSWRVTTPGTLIAVEGVDALGARDGVCEFSFRGVPGTSYIIQDSNLDRIGYVITTATTIDEAGVLAEAARDSIHLKWS